MFLIPFIVTVVLGAVVGVVALLADRESQSARSGSRPTR